MPRYQNVGDFDVQVQARNAKREWVPVAVTVRVLIDAERVARQLASKANRNGTGESCLAGGALVVKVLGRKTNA